MLCPTDLTTPPEYAAVRHLLSAPSIVERTAPHIGEDDFDWFALHGEGVTMSGGERLLVQIAHELWQAEGAVGLREIARRLDRASFQRVVEALAFARGELPFGSERLRAAA